MKHYYPLVFIVLIAGILAALYYGAYLKPAIDELPVTQAIDLPIEAAPALEKQVSLFDGSAQAELIVSESEENEVGIDGETVADISLKLTESDEPFRQAVAQVSESLAQWFQGESMIRKYIVLINGISQGQLIYKHRRFLKAPGNIIVHQDEKGLYLANQSYSRYTSLANAIDSIDVDKGIALYKQFRPLLNTIFMEFSYPGSHQIEDIFMLAAARVIEAPVNTDRLYLIERTINYKFADNELESLSDIDKLMLRMGPENTLMIQAKMRQLAEAVSRLRE